jgi:PIN like domain
LKIAFDEHIPDGMYRVFEALSAERKMRKLIGATGRGRQGGYTIVRSKDYNPSPDDDDYIQGSDAPWITKFSADKGEVIISGNVRMMEVPQEVIAIQNAGIISFYFESGWNRWNFFRKSSLLLWHWELVVKTFQAASSGDVYRIPAVFRQVQALNLIARKDQWEMLTDSHHTTQALKKIRKRLTRKRSPENGASERQGRLPLNSGE